MGTINRYERTTAMAELKGLSGNWVRFTHLAQEMVADPDSFFTKHSVKTSDFACPQGVHDALERGRKLGEAMNLSCAEADAAQLPLPEAVKKLRGTVAQHFGSDFIAETTPFGLLFKERAKPSSDLALAITGTGSCTFCKDNDSPDVD
jgi:hypothetical protein